MQFMFERLLLFMFSDILTSIQILKSLQEDRKHTHTLSLYFTHTHTHTHTHQQEVRVCVICVNLLNTLQLPLLTFQYNSGNRITPSICVCVCVCLCVCV